MQLPIACFRAHEFSVIKNALDDKNSDPNEVLDNKKKINCERLSIPLDRCVK